jgi:hypothetical protein
MARRRHDLADPALLEQPGELALAAPGHVLGAVVGQDLLGRAEVGDCSEQRLAHQRARRRGVQPIADDEAAVVVEECHQVHAPVLTLEHEGEEVRLPQLVGTRALEVLGLLRVRLARVRRGHVARLDQRAADRRGARREALRAQQHRRDAVLAPVGVLLLQQQDRALGRLREPAAGRTPERLVVQACRPQLGEPRLPRTQRVHGQADQRREVPGRQLAPQPAVEDQQALLRREARLGH